MALARVPIVEEVTLVEAVKVDVGLERVIKGEDGPVSVLYHRQTSIELRCKGAGAHPFNKRGTSFRIASRRKNHEI